MGAIRFLAPAIGQGISPESIRQEIDGKDFDEIVALAKATGTTITNVQRPARN
jgi:hypothetical protein